MSTSDNARAFSGWWPATCHGIGIVLLGTWVAGTDMLFGHYTAPVEYLVSAAVAAAAGIVLSAIWFITSARNSSKPAVSIQAVLIIVASTIVWAGYSQYSWEASREARLAEFSAADADRASGFLKDAVKSIGRAKQGRATKADVPVLAKALFFQSDLAWEAAVALKSLGRDAEPAVPDLVQAIRRGATTPDPGWKNPLRVYSGDALAAIGPTSVPALIKMLADENPLIRLTAVESLGLIRTAESLAAVDGVRNDPDERVRKAVEGALVPPRGR